MADIFGRIGDQPVELNNLATEATLRQLLSQSAAAGQNTANSVRGLAQQAGLNLNNAQQQIGTFGKTVAVVGGGIGGLNVASNALNRGMNATIGTVQNLTSGAGNTSEVFASIAQIGGPIGLVASGMAHLAKFQEQMLQSYRQMSASGVNFGGSLTEMRLAASRTYMTLDQFTNIVKNNSEAFARMGGTAEEGAKSFIKVSQTMLKSDFGDRLRALGYTGETASQGLANFINMTGGRSRREMENTEALSKSASQYMGNLDALSQITGKSREQLENQLKEEAANAAFQSYLQGLDETGRAKAMAAMQVAMAQGGKGAVQALQGELLGLGPGITKASADFTGKMGSASGVVSNLVRNIGDSSKTVEDQMREGGRLGLAVATDIGRMGKAADALVFAGDPAVIAGMQTANRLRQQGIQTEADADRQLRTTLQNQRTREQSEAANAAKTEKAVQELGTTILEQLLPKVQSLLTDGFNPMVQNFSNFSKQFLEIPGMFDKLILATGILTGAFLLLSTILGAIAVGRVLRGIPTVGRPGTPPTAPGPGRGTPPTGGPGGRAPGGIMGNLARASAVGAVMIGVPMLLDFISGKLGSGLKPGATEQDQANWDKMSALEKLFSALPRGIEYIGDFIGMDAAAANARQSRIEAETEMLRNQQSQPGATPEAGSEEDPAMVAARRFQEQQEADQQLMENLVLQVVELNNQTANMLRAMRDTAENTKRTYEATKRLDGNLFPTPS